MQMIQEKIISNKLGLLNLAQELQNISKACRVMGTTRDTFYRYRDALAEGGIEAFYNIAINKWTNISSDIQIIEPWIPNKPIQSIIAIRMQVRF